MSIVNQIKGSTDIVKSLDEILQTITDTILLKKNSLDELAELYSKGTDLFISQTEINESLSFVGGSFTLQAVEKRAFEAIAELFFQNNNKEWVKKELKSPVHSSSLTSEASIQLTNDKLVKYKVEAPVMEKEL